MWKLNHRQGAPAACCASPRTPAALLLPRCTMRVRLRTLNKTRNKDGAPCACRRCGAARCHDSVRAVFEHKNTYTPRICTKPPLPPSAHRPTAVAGTSSCTQIPPQHPSTKREPVNASRAPPNAAHPVKRPQQTYPPNTTAATARPRQMRQPRGAGRGSPCRHGTSA